MSSGSIYKASLNRSTKLRNLYVNDARATLTSKTVAAAGGSGTYSVTAGQASWAWASGSNSDGVKYARRTCPAIASNKDDLEIVNGTTWNENIVCVRDVDHQLGRLSRAPLSAALRRDRAAAGLGGRIQRVRNAHASTTRSSS